MEDPDQWFQLLDFLEQEGFDRVFLQLPGVPGRAGRPGEIPIDVESLRPLVASLNSHGMKTYALDGAPHYALPVYHEGVLRTIDHVARYNLAVEPQERFFGVRFDIEPYLLPGFHGPNRSEILTELLQLTAASVQRAHESDMLYGADIPFWYDAPSEGSFQQVTVEYEGVEKPVSEHILDLVDDVSIMDYRTEAHGADGTIRHGLGELSHAERLGKPLFIGIETSPLSDELLIDFQGEPNEGGPPVSLGSPLVALGQAGDSAHAAYLSGSSDPKARSEALSSWTDRAGIGLEGVSWWPVGNQVEVPASKISFSGQDPRILDRVLRDTAEEFGGYAAFAGFAFHHALSYKRLLGR
jgi:hypothetical protein